MSCVVLTMPFWTLKPSWYLRSGLLMRTVVTGGQLTMFIFTWTWFFKPFHREAHTQGHTPLFFTIYFSSNYWVGHTHTHTWSKGLFKNTLMIPWQVARGRPTRLVLLIDMIWSPMLSLPERAAGPPFIMLAKMTVGRMDPQPDSTITTPRISPLLFSSCNWRETDC